MKFTEVTHPDDVEESVHSAESLFRGGVTHNRFEKCYIKKNGVPLRVSVTGCTILDERQADVYHWDDRRHF